MLKPLNHNVILKKQGAQTTTSSGIILTAPKEEASNVATVIAVGANCDNSLNVGDTVIFKEYPSTKFKDGDDEYLIIEDENILAIKED